MDLAPCKMVHPMAMSASRRLRTIRQTVHAPNCNGVEDVSFLRLVPLLNQLYSNSGARILLEPNRAIPKAPFHVYQYFASKGS